MATALHARQYGRFIQRYRAITRERKLFQGTNKTFNFAEGSFSYNSSIRVLIQFRRKIQTQHPKGSFFTQEQTHSFSHQQHSVIKTVKQNKLSFSSIEVNKPLPAHFQSVWQITFKLRSQFQLLSQIRCLIALRVVRSIIGADSNITDENIRKVVNVQQENCRTRNGALRNCSINQILLQRVLTQNH